MKKLLLSIEFMLAVLTVWANPVNFSTARSVAESFATIQKIPIDDTPVVNIAPEGMFHQLYVFGFRGAKGFVIVAADDRVLPILGYSLTNNFPTTDMPEHVRAWYADYEAQIDSLVAHNVEPTNEVSREWNALLNPEKSIMKSMNTTVGPLLTTTWNQSPYYNKLCPAIDRERTVTGCVATATAQILKYWNHPSTGHGSHSYIWNGRTLSADFGNTTYDWSNMPTSLDASSTATEIDAVATLMYHVGVAVEMKYGVSSTGGSGAKNYSSGDLYASSELAFQTYFKYSNTIRDIHYGDMPDSQWKSILKNELDNSRVVLYDGRDASSGHSFVCDGYDASDNFHFNWGWGGAYDGFYALGSLNPGSGGIGGNATYTFNIDNAAVIGIQPITGNIPNNTTVSVTPNNPAYGYTTGSGLYNTYDTIEMMAFANEGYLFDHWDDGDNANPRYMFATNDSINRTAFFKALSADTLHYCSDAFLSSHGSNQYNTFNWGIRYPASSLAANRQLTIVQFYPYETGGYTLKLYQGDNAQMTLVYSQQFNVYQNNEWLNIYLNTPYQIDNNSPLWITLEYSGNGYPMTISTTYSGNRNGIMLLDKGSWISYNDYNIYNSWMIKGITEENLNPTQHFTFTANAMPSDEGSVNPDFLYVTYGDYVRVTAEAASNYRFVNWSDGETAYKRGILISKDTSVTAMFESLGMDTVGYCVHDFISSLGMAYGSNFWGIKFEAGSPMTNRILKAISYYHPDETMQNITAHIYSGGETFPESYLGSTTFTTAATTGWQTFQLTSPIICSNNTLWIILETDASNYPCSYTEYSANPNGSFISLDGGYSLESILDYEFDATWMIRAIVEDQQTIEVVCDSYNSEFYNEFYEWNNDCWVQLYNDDYTFNFNVLCNAGETNIANGQTYTISDMVPGYTWVRDNNTWDYMEFDSASLVRRGNSYEAYVTTTDNIKYHITYNAPDSITQIKDTVSIAINNRNTCSIANSIETASYFQLVGSDANDEYMLYFCIKNTSSIAGTYTIDDVYSLYTGLLHGDDIIQCNSLLPNAVVTAGQTENSYNAVIHFLGSDSVLYEITYEYSDPVSATQVTYNANNLVITKDADYYDYLGNYGLYAYDFEANNGTEILRGIVLNADDNAFGTYSYNDGYIDFGIYDALTEEMMNKQIFNGSLTISQNETGITLTGSALTRGDIEYLFNVTGNVPVPDTFDIACTDLEMQYYSDDNDVYISLTDEAGYSFAFDIYCNGNSHDIVDGQAYTMADMLEEFSMGYNGDREEYIYYSSCTFTRNSHGDVSASVTATTGEVYRITYTALRPVDTVQVVVTDNLSKIRLINSVSNYEFFEFYGPSNDGEYVAYCTFTGVTSIVGTHPAPEVDKEYTLIYTSFDDRIEFDHMAGDAIVTLNGNVYTLEMNYVSTDAILYHVTIQYHEPQALTQETINATNLEIQDADWDENMFTIQCSNSEYLFYAEVNKSNTSYNGSYSANEMSASIYDANTYDLLYYGYTPNITISTINGQQTMTGTLLCYGDILFNINASHTVDTTYIVANEVYATDYTSEYGFCYVQLVDDEIDFTFAVNGVSDLTNGHTYTLADMNSGYSYCININDYNIEFSYLNCTLTRNSAGDYHAEVTATNGDVYIIDYTAQHPVNPSYFFEEADTICQGSIYNWHNRQLTEAGVYYDSLKTTLGEDSVYKLTLTVNPTYLFSDTALICQGTSFTWHSRTYNAAGTYYDSLQTTSGCDSIYQLTLTVNPTYLFSDTALICQGTSFTWHGRTYNAAGTYYDSLQTTSGCDSIYQLTLTVNPTYLFEETYTISEGASYTWHGASYTEAGIYYDAYMSSLGCDSIYQLTLTVTPNVDTKDTLYITMDNNDNIFIDSINSQQTFQIAGKDQNQNYELTLTIANTSTLAGRYTTENVVRAKTSLKHTADGITKDIDLLALSPNAVFIGTTDNFTATINYMSSDSTLYVIDFIYKDTHSAVDNTDMTNYIAYTEGRTIVLNGAQGEMIALYDAAGRLISNRIVSEEDLRIEVPVAGVYMLYVNGQTIRVVIR